MFLFCLLMFLFCLVLVIYIFRKRQMKQILDLSKQLKCGIKSYPLIGHAHIFMGSNIDLMNALMALGRDSIKNGGLSGVWFGQKFYINVVDACDLKVILKTALSKDDNTLQFARKLVGNGLIFAPVPIWRNRRKIIAPTFNIKNLNNFVEIFSRQSAIMVEQTAAVVGQGVVPIWKYLATYTLDVICETTMNVKLNSQINSGSSFIAAFERCCQLLSNRIFSPWLHYDVIYNSLPYYRELKKNKNILWHFIDEAIQGCRKNMQNNKEVQIDKGQTFLERVIETPSLGYTDLELNDEILLLVSAGNDTSAVGTGFVISMLARYPDVQEKVAAELQEVFGDSDKPVSVDDLPRLKYLELVIKETLRLTPPVPLIVRQIEKDLLLPSGKTLVPGCSIFVNIWGTHRNPVYWGDDAEEFRPERFQTPLKHPAAFIPFSYGIRNCLGFQFAMHSMKTALATFLRRYRVLGANEENTLTKTDHKPMTLTYEIMMKDVDGFKVRLENRKTFTSC